MKTKYVPLRTSAIGTIAATLMAVSAQSGVADENQPIWAGHFKEAYSSTSPQSDTQSLRSNPSSVQDQLIWAGHFKDAYRPSGKRSMFASFAAVGEVTAGEVTRPQGQSLTDHLLWSSKYPR